MTQKPTVNGILEAVLYVDDVERSMRFYKQLFGFETEVQADLIGVLRVPRDQALILFPKRIAEVTQPMTPPNAEQGAIPTHGGSGRLHVAFAISPEQLKSWPQRLRENNVLLEGQVRWKRGGVSLYFRDPDGHLIELVTKGIWGFY